PRVLVLAGVSGRVIVGVFGVVEKREEWGDSGVAANVGEPSSSGSKRKRTIQQSPTREHRMAHTQSAPTVRMRTRMRHVFNARNVRVCVLDDRSRPVSANDATIIQPCLPGVNALGGIVVGLSIDLSTENPQKNRDAVQCDMKLQKIRPPATRKPLLLTCSNKFLLCPVKICFKMPTKFLSFEFAVSEEKEVYVHCSAGLGWPPAVAVVGRKDPAS
nr:hypothetical protein [Tanacetum cinerariifolium]